MRPPRSDTLEQRVVRYIEKTPTCWLWRGELRKGYGRVLFGGGRLSAHRVVYEMEVGPIPEGLVIDHLCRNHACVNPEHMEPVTQRVNVLRGVAPAAANARKTHCLRGHAFDDENTYPVRVGGRGCRACDRRRNNTPKRLAQRRAAYRRKMEVARAEVS